MSEDIHDPYSILKLQGESFQSLSCFSGRSVFSVRLLSGYCVLAVFLFVLVESRILKMKYL